eukprot:6211036-Pleurochrysis_carterae.AAC.1
MYIWACDQTANLVLPERSFNAKCTAMQKARCYGQSCTDLSLYLVATAYGHIVLLTFLMLGIRKRQSRMRIDKGSDQSKQ